MKFTDLFKLSTRMFKARTSRTLLTVLGMSIGIGAILFLVSFGYGLQKTLLERITTSESLLTLDVTEAKSGLVSLNSEMIDKIKQLEGVVEVSPAFQLTSQGHIGDISADLVSIGVNSSFMRLGGIRITKGDSLTDNNPEGVIITSSVAQVFGKQDAASMIGEEISFTFFTLKETSDSDDSDLQNNFNRVDLDKKFKIIGTVDGEDNLIYINSSALGDLKINKFNQIKVKSNSQSAMGAIRDNILDQGLLVSSLSDTVDQANQIFRIIQIVLMLFGVIALAVSAIGMFNTMTIALLERTEEIGIMKSIGASDTGVSMMFVMESTIMGFLGGLCGVLIGIIGGAIFNQLINFVASRFGGQSVNLFSSPLWFIAAIIIFAAAVGFITGFVPARRASKIDPLDALRYK
ncbi:MAG: FtsX-like permease family protein [Parcubacteria group bacterium]|jgi:ABC-type antimicrobial peptide transport system permease subunit